MNKIICDVCGTSYPDTAAQCPICGCAKSASAQSVSNASSGNESGYSHVKGGRFSKRNVKKRNKAAGKKAVPTQIKTEKAPQKEQHKEQEKTEKKNDKGGKALLVVAFILILAIVAVLIYIAVSFFGIGKRPSRDPAGESSTQQTTLADDTTEADLSCVSFTLNKTSVEFISEGQVLLLNVKTEPADTTDPVEFSSSNESVATVTSAGRIMAIAPGEATITVSCGNLKQNVKVVCNFESDETIPEDTTAPTVTVPDEEVDLKIYTTDVTFFYLGESCQLFSGKSGKDYITWTSEDEKVVTVKDGVVTAVGPGTTNVIAEYNGEKVTCIFRCSFSMPTDPTDPPLAGDGFDTGISEEDGGNWDDNAVG